MSDLTASDITVTVAAKDRHVLGKVKMSQGSIAFGDGEKTYPRGGVPMPTIGRFGMNMGIDALQVSDESGDGFIMKYDQANRTMKIFGPAPPIVYEELVPVSNDVGYLKYPAAHIEYVSDGADDYRVIPGGLTPVVKSVAVDMGFSLATGVLTRGQRCSLTFNANDGVGSARVSYITQAWKDVTDNMVQACLTSGVRTYGHANLTLTEATPDVVELGEDIVAMQSVCWNEAGTITPMAALKAGVNPTNGNAECSIDMRKAQSFAELEFHETDAVDDTGDLVYFNYIRDPGAGNFLYDRFVETEIEDNANTLTFGENCLLFCTCGGIPMESTTKKCLMTDVGDTLAAGEGKVTTHPFLPGAALGAAMIVTMEAATSDDAWPARIEGHPSELQTVPLELAEDSIIQATTLQFLAWGK